MKITIQIDDEELEELVANRIESFDNYVDLKQVRDIVHQYRENFINEIEYRLDRESNNMMITEAIESCLVDAGLIDYNKEDEEDE